MKRKITVLLIVIVCFLLQTTMFQAPIHRRSFIRNIV